jgi:hypothetical protein
MRPKLATLMQHLKATNARLDRRLQAIEDELTAIGHAEAASVRQLRESLAAVTKTLPGHVNGEAAEC